MRSEFKGNLTQAAIHQLYEKQEARRKKKESGVMIGLKKKQRIQKNSKRIFIHTNATAYWVSCEFGTCRWFCVQWTCLINWQFLFRTTPSLSVRGFSLIGPTQYQTRVSNHRLKTHVQHSLLQELEVSFSFSCSSILLPCFYPVLVSTSAASL